MSVGEDRLSAGVNGLSVGAYGFSVEVDRLSVGAYVFSVVVDRLSVEVDWRFVGLYWDRGLRMQTFLYATSLEVKT